MDTNHLAPDGKYGAGGGGGHPNLKHQDSRDSHQDFFSVNVTSRPASFHETMDGDSSPRHARKLVLCFDGTGNKFHGDDSDSNILKIFRMLDRTASDQYHYYQPGIGTYIVSTSLTHTSKVARLRSWYMKAKDSAIGTSFDQHVVGGYRFLMRFYSPGDEIYIFGFSRGAYTARFLAEMLDYVGLLSHGNEEMISFAWKSFSQWQCRRTDPTPEGAKKKKEMYAFLKGFRETFSRPVRRIQFLGLFDTVNSVPRFETAWMERSKFPYTARTSAKVVRHAVSIDERRAKFRQDLIYQGKSKSKMYDHHRHHHLHHEDEADEDGKYRRRSNNAPHQAEAKAKESTETRGRPPNLDVPEMDEMAPFRPRSRSARSRTPGMSTTADNHSGCASSDAASDMSRTRPPTVDDEEAEEDDIQQDIDEIWFAGGHGDVGGGWEIEPGTKSTSHVPLSWMVREAIKAGLIFDWDKVREMGCLDALEGPDMEPADQQQRPARQQEPAQQGASHGPAIPNIMIRTPSDNLAVMSNGGMSNGGSRSPTTSGVEPKIDEGRTEAEDHTEGKQSSFHDIMRKAHVARIHDSLMWDCGMAFGSVLSWRLMEYLPFRRMDLQSDGSWKPIRWPLPCGEVRDVPDNVRVHGSVIRRMKEDESYRPGNLIVGGGGRGCRVAPKKYGWGDWVCVANEGDPVSEVWVKKQKEEGSQ